MNRLKTVRQTLAGITLALIVGVIWLGVKSSSQSGSVQSASTQTKESAETAPLAPLPAEPTVAQFPPPPAGAPRNDVIASRSISSVGANGEAAKVSGARDSGSAADFKFADRLSAYSSLRKRVLLNDEARASKEQLLRDEELLRGLEPLFKTASDKDLGLLQMQNDGIDLLLDARAVNKAAAAESVLRSIIEDPRVEKPELDLASRKSFAGMKAEVMYQWSSQEPDKTDSIRSWLPGPVSKRIWNNVVSTQEQNVLESQAELADGH